MPSRKALIRRPGPRLAEGLVTHIEREPVDAGLALEQWGAYADALRAHGWETVEVDPADDCPDAVFVLDTPVSVTLVPRSKTTVEPGATVLSYWTRSVSVSPSVTTGTPS